MASSFEKKREEFRKYLEGAGVIESLSKALIKLYEQQERPENAVNFVRKFMCESCPDDEQYDQLKSEYEAAKDRICALEMELKALKGDAKRSPADVQAALKEGFDKLLADEDCKSLLRKFLTAEIFENLKEAETPTFKSNLLDCIQSGLENHDSNIGIYAADAEAYTTFGDLFTPIINDYHSFDTVENKHPDSDWGDPSQLGDLDPEKEFVVSTRVRCGRSISEFPFSPCMTEEQYVQMMDQVKTVLESLDDPHHGAFYPLETMDEATKQKLIDDHYLFKDMNSDRFLHSANADRFWPVGRGIFFNEAKSFLVWCGEEDHLRIISMEEGGNLGAVYARLKEGVEKMAAKINFARDERLGFLTFCPTNLGTTIRASVHIKLPKLGADRAKLDEIAGRHNLQVRGTRGEHTESEGGVYDISNKRRLGLTEFDAVKEMYDGISELIKAEKETSD